MKIKKPIPDINSWSISEILQIGCGFVLAIALTIITIMLFYSTISIYSPSGLEELEGTYEYGLGTVLFGWIPTVIGVFMLPINVLLWINAISNRLIISYISLVLFFVAVKVGGASGILSYIFVPLLLINILFLFLQHHHISNNKLKEKEK